MGVEQALPHIPRLRRYARLLTGNRERADDLVQDTLERACRKWSLWSPQAGVGSGLRGWLLSMMHNVFVNQVRAAPNETALDELADEATHEPFVHTAERLDLQAALAHLNPGLSAQGFTLMGGRLLPGEQAQSRAQFMYEQASGERVTLHVSVFGADATPASTSFRFATDDASSSFYWVDGRYGYALTGKLPRPSLEAVANAAYAQLLPATPSVSDVQTP